ncbi:MAG: serine hydrolase [bacterium]|nr:serine hydrolase [bacterium]
MAPADWANPYADYTVERLYEFLAGHKLARGIGESVEYSNLGYGLLGHALALREGVDYETLIAGRILEPLGMAGTAVELTQPLRERLAPGHDEELRPVPSWDIPALAGAGALRSTVNDLLIFLEANLGLRQTPLREAMARTHVPQVADPGLGMDIGLGWVVADDGERRFVWHNGATGGYSSFIGFDPETREGVVVLSNSVISVDGLAYRLLTHDFNG